MITTVSLNPSVDKGVTIESFQYGSMNRVLQTRQDAGGKAVNVAMVASALGMETRCVGFLCRENGRIIDRTLTKHGVQTEWVWLEGSIRTNLKLLDAKAGIVTEINESGAPVDGAQLEAMDDLIARSHADSDFLVLTGSLPPGCPKSYYAQVIRSLTGSGCRMVLDAEGEALRQGIEARPYLIKPNRLELEIELGHALGSTKEVARAARELNDRGIARVAVSLGAEGALLADEHDVFFAPAMKIDVASTVGAGDSMVSGMIAGLQDELPTDEVLRRGAACAAASISKAGTRLTGRAEFEKMLTYITVERVHI